MPENAKCANPYRDIVRLLSVRSDSNEHANDTEEGVDKRPPREVGVRLLDIANNRGDEGDQPSELYPISLPCKLPLGQASTHNSDRDGRQGKGIANDPADAESRL